MVRLGAILTGLLFGFLLSAPASANTIATFKVEAYLSAITTVIGTFDLDLTAQKVENVSITIPAALGYPGITYSGTSADTYTSALTTQLFFHDTAAILPPLGGRLLSLEFGLNILTDLSTLPIAFPIIAGSDSIYSFLCAGVCLTAPVVGNIKLLSVGTSTPTTPIPATLPLLATALGGMGILGWRRKRVAAPTQAAV